MSVQNELNTSAKHIIIGCLKSIIQTNYSAFYIEACFTDPSLCTSEGQEQKLICLPRVKADKNGGFKIPLPAQVQEEHLASLAFKVYKNKELIRTFSKSSYAECIKNGKKIVLVLHPFDLEKELPIKGKVVDQNGNGLGGLRIVASGGLVQNLEVISKNTGKFSMGIHKNMLENPEQGTHVHFQVFKDKKKIKTLPETSIWNSNNPLEKVKIIVNRLDLETIYTVSGTITYANKKPAANMAVQVFDKDFRAEALLGKVTTNELGKYTLQYYRSKFQKGASGNEKKTADLFIRVFASNNDANFDESAVKYNAGEKATVNLELSNTHFQVKTEFEEIYNCVTPFLKKNDVNSKDLTNHDIQFFAGETGFSEVFLKYFNSTFLMVNEFEVNPKFEVDAISEKAKEVLLPVGQFFYGILRQKNPKELREHFNDKEPLIKQYGKALRYILELSEKNVRKNIDGAIRNFYIQENINVVLDEIIEKIWIPLRLYMKLVSPRKSGVSTEFLLISAGVTIPETTIKYAELLYSYKTENNQFFKALVRDNVFDTTQIVILKFKLKLEEVGHGDKAFTAFLLTMPGINSTEDLAEMSKKDLGTFFMRGGIQLPDAIPGETQEEKLCAFYCLLEYYFPEVYIKKGILDELPGTKGMDKIDLDNLKRDIEKLLKNNPNFKITKGLHQQDKRTKNGKRGLNIEGLESSFDTTVLPYLEKLNRVSRITSRESEIRVLLDDGFHSANKIFLTGQQTFVNTYQNVFGQGRALQMFQTSESITHTATAVYMNQQRSGMQVIAPPQTEIGSELPVWENLFGSTSSCACADCESVLSPSAYLVSLFEFLNSADCFQNKSGEEVLKKLFEHRPDMQCINLNCENTNTELPYIDIANELMEEYIQPSAKGWDKQTTRTKNELEVMPEHINREAYSEIYNSYNLRKLPYHLELDECRSYLNGINIDRLNLTETFLPLLTKKEVLNHRDWAIEKLGINQKEYDIFSGQNQIDTVRFWGETTSSSWWSPLLKLKAFLKKTGLNSREAYTLFDLVSIKNNNEFKIESINKGNNNYTPEDDCNLDLLEIKGNANSDWEPLFRKIYLVLRLKEITGWSFHEVDEYFVAVNNVIDIQEIAQLIALKEQLKLSTYQVLSFYFPFSNTEYTDYTKDRLKSIPSYMGSVFRLLDSNGQILNVSFNATVKSQADLIMSGCRLSSDELNQIVGSRGSSIQWDDTLSLTSLSYIYRFGLLLRSLNITIGEYSFYHNLLGNDPFLEYNGSNNTATPANTLEFIRIVHIATSLKFNKDDLYFILKGNRPQLAIDQEPNVDSATFFVQTENLIKNIYAEEIPLGGIQANLPEAALTTSLKNELASLLEINLDTTLATSLANLILKPGLSHLDLVDNHLWFKYTHHDIDLFRSHFTGNTDDNPNFIENIENRYQYIIRQLIYWNKTVELLSERLADEFSINQKNCRQLLLHDFFNNTENSFLFKTIKENTNSSEQEEKYMAFKKASLVVHHLNLTEPVVEFVMAHPGENAEKPTHGELLNCYNLATSIATDDYESTFTQLENLYNLQVLFNTHQRANSTVLGALKIILQGGSTNQREGFYAFYKNLLGWNDPDLNYLLGDEDATTNWGDFGFNIPLPLPYPDVNNTPPQDTSLIIPLLSKLYSIYTFKQAHKHSIEQLQKWVSNDPGELKKAAVSTYKAFKKNINNSTWRKKASAIRNELREKQRDALVVYLLNKWDLAKPEDLYTKLLLDVEMNSCRNTSRIKSAISSTQLYINRVLMNLEEEVLPLKKGGKKWKWMKQYRIWEAKQKVFFFPENYIVPNLLDTKTHFLKELENDLLKNELDEVKAKEAIITYLEEFGKIARLQVCGIYEEIKTNNVGLAKSKESDEKILHVFARTWSKPHTYFYRKQDACGIWTAWEKVDADLEGAQLIPIVYNNRMYVFWPEITQEVDDMGDVMMNGIISGITNMVKLMADFANMGYQFITGFPDIIQQGGNFVVKNSLEGLRNVARSIRESVSKTPLVGGSIAADINKFAIGPLTDMIDDINIDNVGFDISDFTSLFDGFIQNGDDFLKKIIKDHYDLLPKKRWNIKLAWCEETQGKWSAKKIADASLEYEDAIGAMFGSGNKSFIFNGSILTENSLNKIEINCATNGLDVDLSRNHDKVRLEKRPVGKFLLENRLSPLKAIRNSDPVDGFELIQDLTGDIISGIKAEANNLQAMALGHPVSESDQEGIEVRDTMDAAISFTYRNSFGFYDSIISPNQPQFWFQLITPHQYPIVYNSNQGYNHPFFYQDARNTYFVNANNLSSDSLINSLEVFKHPFVSDFVSRLDSLNLDGFYSLDTQQLDKNNNLILLPEKVEFNLADSHSQYNWELFFHTPFIIADRLRQNQKYEHALKWLNFIFDPTISSSNPTASGPTATSKYWITKPFFDTTSADYQEASLKNILGLDDENSDSTARQELECLTEKLIENPFNVHLIARYRTTAYQKAVVMLYADILIEWGDHLFRQYTIETITEAFSHYYTALTLLGDRPEVLPAKSKVDRSYKSEQTTENKSNHIEVLESILVTNGRPSRTHAQNGMSKAEIFKYSNCIPGKEEDSETINDPDKDQNTEIIRSLSNGYFCLPRNKKLHAYWDTLADRMYKIRNCLNIKGELQMLSLFQPEINPELFVKIAAQGGSINDAAGFLNMPPGHYRFNYVLQKAFELCGELKSLGSALLSSIEKRDGEELLLVRNTHEQKMLDRIFDIKKIQFQEAELSIQSLEKQIESTHRRKEFYIGNLEEPLNIFEAKHLNLTNSSNFLRTMSSNTKLAAAISFLIPQIKGGAPTTLGASSGGENIGSASKEGAESLSTLSSIISSIGSMIGTMGSNLRKIEDWTLQKDVLDVELENMGIQIESTNKRLEISQKELDNHTLQKEQSEEIRDYMEDKFSNVELYNWQVNEISKIFFRTYQLTFDLALQAEKAYQMEMGVETSNYIQYGRWDSLKKGLLSGEKLFADLKEMEIAYMQRNTRKPELTKTISLKMLNPLALLQLKTQGACEFNIPEYIFDLDHPGHYFRRIKSVSVSIPCIAGPYTGVNTKLSLLSNETRKNTQLVGNSNNEYLKLLSNPDNRFVSNSIGVNTIATSSAQNDNGMFEFNLRDERYLPFEGAGVISSWKLELPPPSLKQFDYNSISDVLLHINYTARGGGSDFREKVVDSIDTLFTNMSSDPMNDNYNLMTRLFSLKHDFPNEWHRYITDSGATNFKAIIKKEHFNYLTQGKDISNIKIKLWNATSNPSNDIIENDAKRTGIMTNLNNPNQPQSEIELDDSEVNKDEMTFMILEYSL